MKALVVGSGAREHALAWALRRHAGVLCSPGNGGTSPNMNVPLDTLSPWCKDHGIDLVVVGPEAPLADGLADTLRQNGIRVFGPGRDGARLEASKAHAKAFMERHHVPTAYSETVHDMAQARTALAQWGGPVVVKASGLAAGKGVTLHDSAEDALVRVRELLEDKVLGAAGEEVVLEERLEGHELSLLALVSGDTWQALPLACDYKRLLDGDEGPNTGGMGAFCPAPIATPRLMQQLGKDIMGPIMRGLKKDGIDYRGILYVGLMLTADGPKVLEFNVRFGDPETQVIVPLLDGSWLDVLNAVVDGQLHKLELRWKPAATCGVVVASRGYPQASDSGLQLPPLPADDVLIFHAGTRLDQGQMVSHGGRILTAVATRPTLEEARQHVYQWLSQRDLSRFQYRHDIGRLETRLGPGVRIQDSGVGGQGGDGSLAELLE